VEKQYIVAWDQITTQCRADALKRSKGGLRAPRCTGTAITYHGVQKAVDTAQVLELRRFSPCPATTASRLRQAQLYSLALPNHKIHNNRQRLKCHDYFAAEFYQCEICQLVYTDTRLTSACQLVNLTEALPLRLGVSRLEINFAVFLFPQLPPRSLGLCSCDL
jgi:hypothetical protein